MSDTAAPPVAGKVDDVETLAMEIHQAGRGQVDPSKPTYTTHDWNEISEESREGRRRMARHLLERYDLRSK